MLKKILRVIPFVLILLALIAFPVFAQGEEPAEVVPPESVAGIISAISGLLSMSFVQLIKKYTGWEETKAFAAATLTSLALAIVVVIVNGTIVDMPLTLENISLAFSTTFTVATLFYKALVSIPAKMRG